MNKNARQELRPTLGEYLLVDAPHKAQDPVLVDDGTGFGYPSIGEMAGYMDADDDMEDCEVFEVKEIVSPGPLRYPTTGHVGYVKIENADEIIKQCNPRWFEVDDRAFETVV